MLPAPMAVSPVEIPTALRPGTPAAATAATEPVVPRSPPRAAPVAPQLGSAGFARRDFAQCPRSKMSRKPQKAVPHPSPRKSARAARCEMVYRGSPPVNPFAILSRSTSVCVMPMPPEDTWFVAEAVIDAQSCAALLALGSPVGPPAQPGWRERPAAPGAPGPPPARCGPRTPGRSTPHCPAAPGGCQAGAEGNDRAPRDRTPKPAAAPGVRRPAPPPPPRGWPPPPGARRGPGPRAAAAPAPSCAAWRR
jgi:hypothetical protein